MNPARTFGPAFWNKNWNLHWLYWLAPMTGSLSAAKIYRQFFWRESESEEIFESCLNDETKVKASARRSDNENVDLNFNIELNKDNNGLKNVRVLETSDINGVVIR